MSAAGTSDGAVITGVGVVAPNGVGAETYWGATLAGVTGIRELTRFEAPGHSVRLAGEVDLDVADHVPGRLVPQTDATTRYALAASELALRDAGLRSDDVDAASSGVVTASASGGFAFGQRELQHLWSNDWTHVSAYMCFAWFYAVNAGQLSIHHDLRGPTGVLVTEQAGGIDALGQARRSIRSGTSTVLTGGTDASVCPFGWAAHGVSGACTSSTDPGRAYRPFAADADGYVPGEGGAIMVVESEDHARARGARPRARVAGYGAAFDPDPSRPTGLRRAADAALADAGLAAGDIGAVFADGSADPVADLVESRVLAGLFGPHGVPVTAPKVLTGRLFSGAALDIATAVLALDDRVLPPTPGVTPAPEHELDLVLDEPRPYDGGPILILARGHGGFCAATVLTRGTAPDPSPLQEGP